MKLNNTPLVEVVFELRWALPGRDDVPAPFRQDPGYGLLVLQFPQAAKDVGYSEQTEVGNQSAGPISYNIQYRFLKEKDQPFPVMQIGPGIFAANMSSDYEWEKFRAQIDNGVDALLKAYPQSSALSLRPLRVEIRYINAFSDKHMKNLDIVRFLKEDTKINFSLPEFFSKTEFSENINLQLRSGMSLKSDPSTNFSFDIATGQANTTPAIIVVTRIVKAFSQDGEPPVRDKLRKQILEWADSAQPLALAFFQDLLSDDFMTKLREPSSATAVRTRRRTAGKASKAASE